MIPKLSSGKRTNLGLTTANIILVANAFIWYLIAFKGLLSQQNDSDFALLIIGLNTGAIVISGLVGTFLVDKIKDRRVFLYFWLASGIVISVIPLGLNISNPIEIAAVSILFGAYFGLGMPATMGYHVSFSPIEGRAKIGGLTFLVIGVTFAAIGLTDIGSILAICIILAALRTIGLVIFHFMPVREVKKTPPADSFKVKYRSIILNKSFVLYFVPWCMFTLVNYLTIPITTNIYPPDPNIDYSEFLPAMEYVVVAFVAVISGFIADRWGRKRIAMIGFIMLGIGYAVIGLSIVNNLNNMLIPSIVFTITDGAAWGIFYVLFIFTLWGDLAQNRNSDKFYFLGVLPYISSFFMQLYFAHTLTIVTAANLSKAIFSFASVFLFLAVLPLVYAPETLPEKLIKDRDLKSYVEKAKQKARKETAKAHNKRKTESHSVEDEVEEKVQESGNDKAYNDAVKLAEKYY